MKKNKSRYFSLLSIQLHSYSRASISVLVSKKSLYILRKKSKSYRLLKILVRGKNYYCVKAELTYLLSSLHNTCNNVYSKLFFAKPVLPKKFLPFPRCYWKKKNLKKRKSSQNKKKLQNLATLQEKSNLFFTILIKIKIKEWSHYEGTLQVSIFIYNII